MLGPCGLHRSSPDAGFASSRSGLFVLGIASAELLDYQCIDLGGRAVAAQGAMTGWRIDPTAANAAVTDAKERLAGLDAAAAIIQSAIEEASKVVGPKTAAALAILARDPFQMQIDNVNAKITKVATQATQALAAYENGDAEMAVNSAHGQGR
jgi:hypothetical protein